MENSTNTERKYYGLEVWAYGTEHSPGGDWIPYDASYYKTLEEAQMAARRKSLGKNIRLRACEVLPPLD